MMSSQPAEVGDDRFVAEHDAVVDTGTAADVTMPAENRVADRRVLADAGVGPDNRAFYGGMLLEMTLPPDDAVRADARARFDHGALVDEAGAGQRHAVLDPRLRLEYVKVCSL